MIELLFAPGACSFVPHVALEAVKAAGGDDYVPKLVKLHKGEHRSAEFLALNPEGLVPVLVVDGHALAQLLAICDWIDRRWPQAALFPSDPWMRSQAMSRLAWMNNTLHPTFRHIFMPSDFADDAAAREEVRRFATAKYRGQLEQVQAQVAKASPYWFGDRVGFVDAYALTLLRWGGMAGIDPDTLPVYKAYVERVAAAAPVAAALARERIPLHAYAKP